MSRFCKKFKKEEKRKTHAIKGNKFKLFITTEELLTKHKIQNINKQQSKVPCQKQHFETNV